MTWRGRQRFRPCASMSRTRRASRSPGRRRNETTVAPPPKKREPRTKSVFAPDAPFCPRDDRAEGELFLGGEELAVHVISQSSTCGVQDSTDIPRLTCDDES